MGTVSKALELLGLFTQPRPLIGLSDLARLAGVNKATCFRLISELAEHGLVEQIAAGREYRLGPNLLRLAALREAAVPTRQAALPVLQSLALKTGETAHLSLLMGDRLTSISHCYSTDHMTRVTMDEAQDLPFHATSSGLAVLAFQSPAFRDKTLSQPLIRLTTKTKTDRTALVTELQQIVLTGVAESIGGFEAEVHSLAVPVFDARGQCVGAVAVAGIASRMTTEKAQDLRATLRLAGQKITQVWGGSLPPALHEIWANAA